MYTKSLFAAILISVGGQLFSQIPTASLVGYYPFTGNANDLSGNSLNGPGLYFISVEENNRLIQKQKIIISN